jgi:N-acetylglucosamine-6-phosphate deacetylase
MNQITNHNKIVITNAIFYRGTEVEYKKCLLIENGVIVGFCSPDDKPSGFYEIDGQGLNICPGLIDCQVNGACGVVSSLGLSYEQYKTISDCLAEDGTTRWVPTILSPSTKDLLFTPSQNISGLGIVGFHIEGPLISAKRRGFHSSDKIKERLSKTDLDSIIALSKLFKVILTGCPNKLMGQFDEVKGAQIILAAGHTDCDYTTACDFFNSGGNSLTHAFNATGGIAARDPNVINAAIDSKGVFVSVVNDGIHVHESVVRMLKRAISRNHLFYVSDLMPTYNNTNAENVFYGKKINVDRERLTDSDGNIAGSNSPLIKAIKHSVQKVGIPLDESIRMATLYPAQYLKIDDKFGLLNNGYVADLVAFNNQLEIGFVIKGGEFTYSNKQYVPQFSIEDFVQAP